MIENLKTKSPPFIPNTPEKCCERYRDAQGTMRKIIEAFGGLGKYCQVPFLPWENKFYGGTGYLDRITPEYVSAPVMRGEDFYGRPFIILKTKLCDKDLGDFRRSSLDMKHTQVLFQRYTDNPNTWVSSDHYARCPINIRNVFGIPNARGEEFTDLSNFLQKDGPLAAYCDTHLAEVKLDDQ